MTDRSSVLVWLEDITLGDAERVGGRAASLGEMCGGLGAEGIRVPEGFATTVAAHQLFVRGRLPAAVWTGLDEPAPGARALGWIPPGDTLEQALTTCFEEIPGEPDLPLCERCALARHLVETTPIPEEVRNALIGGYARLCEVGGHEAEVAVRSSAAQPGSFLNVRSEEGVLHYWKQCLASQFTESAVSHRLESGLGAHAGSLAVVVMRMVRADSTASGVILTSDPESGHGGVVRMASSYGLGGLIDGGDVSPDSFLLWKQGLDEGRPAIIQQRVGDKARRQVRARGGRSGTEVVPVPMRERRAASLPSGDVLELGRMGLAIERHFGRPMEIAWAKDERSGELFVVRARPCLSARPAPDALELGTRLELDLHLAVDALRDSLLPSAGVGLARLESVLTSDVGIHPLALVFLNELKSWLDGGALATGLRPYAGRLQAACRDDVRAMIRSIEERTIGYMDKREFFVERMRAGVALICAAFYPRPVSVRLPDLASREYRELVAGGLFEPAGEEAAPGRRGVSRLVDPQFRPVLSMMCEALREVHSALGLDNLRITVPCCRTPEEGAILRGLLDEERVSPDAGIPLFLMLESPANVIDGRRLIDSMGLSGGSIAMGELLKATYGLGAGDAAAREQGVDPCSPAVRQLIRQAVRTWREARLGIGICSGTPSDFSEETLAFLVECGVTSVTVEPQALGPLGLAVAQAASRVGLRDQTRLKLDDKYAELERLRRKRRE